MVHLTGIITVIDDPKTIKSSMVDMTRYLEAPDHRYSLSIDDPKMDSMIPYIHAFEIEVTRCEGKFKLSQDKCEQDQINANDQLIKTSKIEIDLLVKKLLK